MGLLKQLDIVKGDDLIASSIFENLFPNFFDIRYKKPSEYVNIIWSAYEAFRKSETPKEKERDNNRNVNGKIFEFILSTLLIRENIYPIFLNARVAFVPNINYDIMLYSEERGPICLSAKTSFRERYKQADLEAIALKYVHRKSLSFLVTLGESDANDVSAKIKKGDVIGLDQVIYAKSDTMNLLISDLKKYKFLDSPMKKVIDSNQIVTVEKIKAHCS